MDVFQNTGFKESSKWHLRESQSTDKLSRKVMSFSYHIELKTFIEASCTNNIHTEKRLFAAATFKGFWVVSFQT